MPPHRPAALSAFLGRICRNLSLDRWRRRGAEKRRGEPALALEELADCVPAGGDAAGELEAKELAGRIDAFLAGLPKTERQVFVCRYWYLDPLEDIGARFGFSRSKVKSMLHRTRCQLGEQLRKEGYLDERG
ncbi:MAG: RNA polymerase sigma factor [Oscillospiraceae bacterium]